MDPWTSGNAFAIPDLWKRSIFSQAESDDAPALFPPLQLDLSAIKLDNPYAPKRSIEHDLRIPDLETFRFGPIEDADALSESVISAASAERQNDSTKGEDNAEDDTGEDIWDAALGLGPVDRDARFCSWEAFQVRNHVEPRSAYLSEAGPRAFDAALELYAEGNRAAGQAGSAVRSNALLKALLDLGLGRSSALFKYDGRTGGFQSLIKNGRMSGYSLITFRSLYDSIAQLGAHVTMMRAFAESTYSSNSFPSRVALGNAVSDVLFAVESQVVAHRRSVRSLLQLEELFRRPVEVLSIIKRAVEIVKTAKTNEQVVQGLYLFSQSLEQGSGPLRSLMLDILSRVCLPWLETVAEWTGLRKEQGSSIFDEKVALGGGAFVGVAQDRPDEGVGLGIPNFEYREDMMLQFIPEEEGWTIFETGRNLRLLRAHHPDHPLADLEAHGVEAPHLELRFGWDDMERIADKAKEYESQLLQAVRRQRRGLKETSTRKIKTSIALTAEIPENCWGTNDFEIYDEATGAVFDSIPAPESTNLPPSVISYLSSSDILSSSSETEPSEQPSTFPPPLSLTPLLSLQPLLTVQSRLLNRALLRAFFRSHNLRVHLRLQHSFQLFGDGVFVARLNAALFSPALSSAEKKKGVMRVGGTGTMGLKLGRRRDWPPAESELWLVLKGILGECWADGARQMDRRPPSSSRPFHEPRTLITSLRENSSRGNHVHTQTLSTPLSSSDPSSLPGNLSFSIRVLPPADIPKCLDPHSFHALDFLRLSYTPPAPLGAVISPSSLDKYDAVFKLLLRVMRLQFVVADPSLRGTGGSIGKVGRGGGGAGTAAERTGLAALRLRFWADARVFVAACASYFFETGVREVWEAFEARLDGIERAVAAAEDEDEESAAGEGRAKAGSGGVEGVDALRKAHEECLDAMMWRLLLRRRQAKVMELLEEIWEAVLGFAKVCGELEESKAAEMGDSGGCGEAEKAVRALYREFRSKVAVFLTVCKGLVGKKGYGKGRAAGEENTVARLVVVLEMNGHFASPTQV
ncbi:Spc98 family-domain-containing protein [Lineolata rhizophorae]|uniref:Spindle pole body component n=1 Tax=Lineolata rhizophorae TaxID=578093 RepID=A0A6A6NWE6_9PEZI|nr:Spc98 family-domain-containing protein [Lineolata rhizophorae]